MMHQLKNFLCQIHVLLSGAAALIVVDNRHAHDLGFAQFVVVVDQRLEGLITVDMLQFTVNDLRSRGPVIIHGDQHAGGDGRIGLLPNQIDQFQDLIDAVRGQVVALGGNDDQIRSGQRV